MLKLRNSQSHKFLLNYCLFLCCRLGRNICAFSRTFNKWVSNSAVLGAHNRCHKLSPVKNISRQIQVAHKENKIEHQSIDQTSAVVSAAAIMSTQQQQQQQQNNNNDSSYSSSNTEDYNEGDERRRRLFKNRSR